MLSFLPALGFQPEAYRGDCPPTYQHFVRPSRLGALHLCVKELVRFELHVGHPDYPLLTWAGSFEDLRKLLGQWLAAHGL